MLLKETVEIFAIKKALEYMEKDPKKICPSLWIGLTNSM